MDLLKWGYTPDMSYNADSGVEYAGIPARVTAVHRERYELVCEYGMTAGRLKTSNYYNGSELFPTAGDFVMIDYIAGGEARITKTLNRKTLFSRLDPSSAGYGEQAVAANFDYVFIMQSLNFDYNRKRLERYLTLAWKSGAIPVILLTKSDLTDDMSEQLRDIERIASGVGVFAVSAVTGSGLDALSDYLKPGKTAVFLGSSGVGKSSLVNALAGRDIMSVNTIREDDSKGRHTTTHRQLIMLDSGVMIIDTPGMRELGMWDSDEGLSLSFNDVAEFTGKCRYKDCRHEGEPGCAIKEALDSGKLSRERWESYLNLKREGEHIESKAEFLRKKRERFKNIAMDNKNAKKWEKGR